MEWAAFALDTLAVGVIVAGALIAAVQGGLIRTLVQHHQPGLVPRDKQRLVGSLLLGLDLLVASDVIKTAALDATLYNVGTLGLLVVVRVALTWSLVVEVEGRWPWQPPRPADRGKSDESQ